MALTATATSSSLAEISSILGMKQPKIVSISPNRPNIKYSVCNGGEMEDSFSTLIEDIQRNRTSTDKTIIFCRTYESCGMLYMLLIVRWLNGITYQADKSNKFCMRFT